MSQPSGPGKYIGSIQIRLLIRPRLTRKIIGIFEGRFVGNIAGYVPATSGACPYTGESFSKNIILIKGR